MTGVRIKAEVALAALLSCTNVTRYSRRMAGSFRSWRLRCSEQSLHVILPRNGFHIVDKHVIQLGQNLPLKGLVGEQCCGRDTRLAAVGKRYPIRCEDTGYRGQAGRFFCLS